MTDNPSNQESEHQVRTKLWLQAYNAECDYAMALNDLKKAKERADSAKKKFETLKESFEKLAKKP